MHRGAGTGALGDRVRVLLVEDDPGDALLVREFLARRNAEFSVIWAKSLAEAVGAIGPTTDCILLDLGLPDTQGLDGLQTILARNHRAAVVVLTGFDDRSSGEKALALGAQDYLTKGSVNDESLARALRYAITRRRSEEDARRLREAELLRAENSRLERGLLPSPLILNPSLSWATRYRPGGLRALLGGDFFDAVELGDGTIRVVIGDVAGHGPDEAALGVALRVAWRALVLAGQPADSALRALERVLEAERNDDGMFVTFATLCDIEIEPGLERAKIYLAGHPAPFLFDGENVFEAAVSRRRPPLGAVKTAGACTPNVVELGSEWTMVAFTDGIFEGRTGQGTDRLDTEGLIRLTEGAFQRGTTLREVASLLVAAAEEANGEPLADDVALVVLSTAARWRN